MPFEYACFISYRNHEQSELAERFIEDLYAALRNELIVLLDEDLFVDRERIRGGAFYNPVLARALCRSVCMIVVYTPTYFSRKHLYCAREYRAMETLEQQRLPRLQKAVGKESGLILPIVLRGSALLPAAIKDNRHCYTFERFSLTSRQLAKNREFEEEIRKIASEIHVRHQLFAGIADDLTCNCEDFNLPTEAEMQPWLDLMMTPASPFPFRAI